jgi:hypothetical protein
VLGNPLHRDTICRLLVAAGEKRKKLMGRFIGNVPGRNVECDENWSFIGKKEKMVDIDDDPNLSDACTLVAIKRNTKLVLNFALGKRDQKTCNALSKAYGLRPHRSAFRSPQTALRPIKQPFPTRSGIAAITQGLSRSTALLPKASANTHRPKVVDTEVVPFCGNPDPRRICTPSLNVRISR